MEAATMPTDDSLSLFLDLLLANKPDDAYVLIWTFETIEDVDTKRSYWCQTKAQVIATINKIQKSGRHVYIGCGWTLKELGPNERAKSAEIDAVPGKWFDLDIQNAVHKKSKNDTLPPDIQSAIKALKDITPEPTIVVSSGYGLHLWWLYEQPWIFEDADDRKRAEQLSRAWQKYIQARLKELGWASDTTSDLARVLRPPGTYNYKVADDPKLVEIIHSAGVLYSPDALREWLKTHDKGIVASIIPEDQLAGSSDFILRDDAEPPSDKWAELLALDVSISELWNHIKKVGTDLSQTGWDSSLSCAAARAGWKDQEIVNLIIANRRKFGEPLLLDNRHYYEVTLDYARKHAASFEFGFFDDEKEVREKLNLNPNDYAANQFTDEEANKALAIFNRWLDIGAGADGKPALSKIICFTSSPAVYYVELYSQEGELRREKIGDGNDIRDQRKWSRLIWDVRGHDTRKIKQDKWQEAIRLIARIMARESPGAESTESQTAMAWIRDYVGPDVKVIDDKEERYECLKTTTAFIEHGKVHLSLTKLVMYLRTHRNKNIDEKDLSIMLRNLGGSQKDINFRLKGDDRRQQRRYWAVPWNFETETYSAIDDGEVEPTLPSKKIQEPTFEDI
jgi:hypothetical protein